MIRSYNNNKDSKQQDQMTKKYSPVTNEQRHLLVKLIHQDGMSIRQAALSSRIYYPTAKAINKIYTTERRVDKK